MYGEVPKGTRSLRCRMGRHIGQDNGGLMCFQCPRCGGTYPQTDPKYVAAMEQVKFLETMGDMAGAVRVFEQTTGQKLPVGIQAGRPS